jgi:hypothetical protein
MERLEPLRDKVHPQSRRYDFAKSKHPKARESNAPRRSLASPIRLREHWPRDADRARALEDGVVCYLRKPVDEQRLTRWLQAALAFGEPPEDDASTPGKVN